MNKGNKILIGIGLFIVLLIGMGGCTYNGMMRADENVKKTWGQVENMYQRRADLIPNLVNTVKGYAAHESSVLENVTDARAGIRPATPIDTTAVMKAASEALNAPDANSYATAMRNLNRQFDIYVNAVHEAYPDLKANENFAKLQDELAGTENRVSKARQDYVEAVNTYNIKVRRFPGNMLAGMFGFSPRPEFQAEPGAEKAPKVEF